MTIDINEVQQSDDVWQSYMEVRHYKVLSRKDNYILVKQTDELTYHKVYDFELNSDMWHLTEADAKATIKIVNVRENVSSDKIVYRRGFKLKKEDLTAGKTLFESCFFGSQFIGATKNNITVVVINVIDIFNHKGTLVAKINANEISTDKSEDFHVTLDSLLNANNMFTDDYALYADRYRTAKSQFHEMGLLYDEYRPFYNTLTTEQQKIITSELETWHKIITKFDLDFQNYLDKNKTATSFANAERDAQDILQQL